MKKEKFYNWIFPLIETENLKNVLLIGNVQKKYLDKYIETVSDVAGNLFVANDNYDFNYDNYDKIIMFNNNVSSVFVNLQLKKVKIDLIVLEECIEEINLIFDSKLSENCLIIINKSLDCSYIKKICKDIKKIIETNNYYIYF